MSDICDIRDRADRFEQRLPLLQVRGVAQTRRIELLADRLLMMGDALVLAGDRHASVVNVQTIGDQHARILRRQRRVHHLAASRMYLASIIPTRNR